MAKRTRAVESNMSDGPAVSPRGGEEAGSRRRLPCSVATIVAKFPRVLQPTGWAEDARHRVGVVLRGCDSLDPTACGARAGGGRAAEGAANTAGVGVGSGGGGGSRISHSLVHRARLVVRRVADPVQGFAFLRRESERGGEWYRAVAAALGQRFPVMESAILNRFCEEQYPGIQQPEPMAERVLACTLAFQNAELKVGSTDELQHLLVCCHRNLGRWMVSASVLEHPEGGNPFEEFLASCRMLPWNEEGLWWQSRCTMCTSG